MDDPGPGPLPGKGKGKEKKLEWLVLQGNWTRLASHGTVTKVPYLVLLDSLGRDQPLAQGNLSWPASWPASYLQGERLAVASRELSPVRSLYMP